MKEVDYVKVGTKLRNAREYLELTQEQVAKILNVGRDAILRIEKGTRKVSADELANFSKLYKITMDEIINDDVHSHNEQAFASGFETLSLKFDLFKRNIDNYSLSEYIEKIVPFIYHFVKIHPLVMEMEEYLEHY